jgi:hypothetical protein
LYHFSHNLLVFNLLASGCTITGWAANRVKVPQIAIPKKSFSNYFLGQLIGNQTDVTKSKQVMGATDWLSMEKFLEVLEVYLGMPLTGLDLGAVCRT